MNTILTPDERRAAIRAALDASDGENALHNLCRELEAAVLAKLPAVVQVPQGYKLVPVEPTREMVRAGARCASSNMCWAEMLAAAPEAPANAVVQVPQGWLDDLRIAMEHSAWDGVLQLSDALANISDAATSLAAPEAPAQPADVRETLKVAREALAEEKRVRLLGQEPDVHWESMRDTRRACYAATDAALARIDALGGGE